MNRKVVGLPWAADSCPWVGKLRTALPLSDVIRDSAVQLVLTQRGAKGAYLPNPNLTIRDFCFAVGA
jgi:hypothetical protein